jgi:hypothetical protein
VCGCININKNLTTAGREFLDLNEINEDYIYPKPEKLAELSFLETLRHHKLDK